MSVERGSLSIHRAGPCPNAIVPCPAADLSCPWRAARHALPAHSAACHFTALAPLLRPMLDQIERGATRIGALEAEMRALKTELKEAKVEHKIAVVGEPLTRRSQPDGAVGYVFVHDGTPLPAGRVTDWSYFSYSAGRVLTPLLLQRQANGTFTVIGIGQARTSTGVGIERFPISMTAGTAVVADGSCRLGWKDGSNGTDNAGVACWDAGGPMVRWFGQRTAMAIGDNYTELGSGARTYSLQFSVQM